MGAAPQCRMWQRGFPLSGSVRMRHWHGAHPAAPSHCLRPMIATARPLDGSQSPSTAASSSASASSWHSRNCSLSHSISLSISSSLSYPLSHSLPCLFSRANAHSPTPLLWPLPRRHLSSPPSASASSSASLPPSAAVYAPPSTEAQAPSFVDGDLRYAGWKVADPSGAGADAEWGWDEGQSDIVFVGTGTSEGIPRVSCLTDPGQNCPVCVQAAIPGNKNRRRNTSLLVRYSPKAAQGESPLGNGSGSGDSGEGPENGRRRNILIDAGKFFYHSALQWFPKYRVRHLDAVIITHSHADAIGGLDCLRDWTNNVESTNIPIYVPERDLQVMRSTHYYLVDTSTITPGTAVSQLQFEVIDTRPFSVHGLQVTPLPVWHGPGYLSFGYRFGDICYISDVSEIPDSTYPLLENCDLLIIDALRPDRSSTTHMGLPAALEEVRKIRPKRTLFTGMMHVMDHDPVNEMLAKLKDQEGLDCQLSYDGLRLPVDLP